MSIVEVSALPPAVSIVIVTHNSARFLDHCIAHLGGSQSDAGIEIVLVDAGSRDPRYVSRYADSAKVILLQNDGFGVSCNVGALHSSGRWLLFLNCDVDISRGQIAQLAELADAANLAVVAPRLTTEAGEYVSFGHTQYPPWRRRPTVRMIDLPPALSAKLRFVGCVSGACMLVARRWFDEVHGFDPRFFMYSEEVDLHRRIAEGGGAIGLATAVVVLHRKEMGSEGVSARWRFVERRVGHTLYMHKHYGMMAAGADVGQSLASIFFLRGHRPISVSLKQYLVGVRRGLARSRR